MGRRERPELMLSPAGQPRYFISGVEDYSDHVYVPFLGRFSPFVYTCLRGLNASRQLRSVPIVSFFPATS